MCLGLGNGCVTKEELTVIVCEKCGRSWQVTEQDAENFSNHRGICPECRKKSKEKTTSLLKPYTNFDKIKNMSLNEMAEFIQQSTLCCNEMDCDNCPICLKRRCTAKGIKQWLMQEAKQ